MEKVLTQKIESVYAFKRDTINHKTGTVISIFRNKNRDSLPYNKNMLINRKEDTSFRFLCVQTFIKSVVMQGEYYQRIAI